MDRKKELGFYWIAKFSDGSKIEQFDKNGEEALYKKVLDNYNDLISFSITDGKKLYTVDLVNWKLITPDKTYTSKGKNPKLLYFRRNQVRVEVGVTQKLLFPRVFHHIGIDTDTEYLKIIIFAGQGMRPESEEFERNKK